MKLSHDDLYMCQECRKVSGDGGYIRVRYTNTGGWSPAWEGRVCEHVTAEDVLGSLTQRPDLRAPATGAGVPEPK